MADDSLKLFEAFMKLRYDQAEGRFVNLAADAEAWTKGYMAGVRVQAKRSGTYYIVFQVDDTKLKRTRWAVAYGYK